MEHDMCNQATGTTLRLAASVLVTAHILLNFPLVFFCDSYLSGKQLTAAYIEHEVYRSAAETIQHPRYTGGRPKQIGYLCSSAKGDWLPMQPCQKDPSF